MCNCANNKCKFCNALHIHPYGYRINLFYICDRVSIEKHQNWQFYDIPKGRGSEYISTMMPAMQCGDNHTDLENNYC